MFPSIETMVRLQTSGFLNKFQEVDLFSHVSVCLDRGRYFTVYRMSITGQRSTPDICMVIGHVIIS